MAALAMLGTGLPAAAQVPTDYDDAVAARRADEPARAVTLLDRWLAQHPADSDALVQRGYAHLALGDLNAAQRDFEAALAIAPGYADASAGLQQVARRRDETPAGFLVVGGAFSDLEAGARDWGEASIDGEVPLSPTASVGARAGWYRRFGLEDIELGGRLGFHPDDDVWLRANVGGTPSADFRPELALGAGVDVRVARGPQATVLTFDASWQRFPAQQVWSLNPGVTQYFGAGKWSATARGIGIVLEGGSLEVGILGRLDYAPTERQRYFIGAVNGPDTDIGIVSRVTSIFAGAEVPLGGGLSLLPSVAQEWRSAGFDRTEFRLEVKAAF